MAQIQPLQDRPDLFVEAIDRELMSRVRSGLRQPLMEEAEKIVDAVVDTAMEGMKPDIEAWVDRARRDMNLNIVMRRAPAKSE